MIICAYDWETLSIAWTNPTFIPVIEFGYVIFDSAVVTPKESLIHWGSFPASAQFNEATGRVPQMDTLNWWKHPDRVEYYDYLLTSCSCRSYEDFKANMTRFIKELETYKVDYIACSDKHYDYAILVTVLNDLQLRSKHTNNFRKSLDTRILSMLWNYLATGHYNHIPYLVEKEHNALYDSAKLASRIYSAVNLVV